MTDAPPHIHTVLSRIRISSQRAAREEAYDMKVAEQLAEGGGANHEQRAKIKKREDGRVARFSDRNYKSGVETLLHQTRAQIEQLLVFLSVTEGAPEVATDRRDIIAVLDQSAFELAQSTYRSVRGENERLTDELVPTERKRQKNKESAYVSRYKGHHYKLILESELQRSLEMLHLMTVATDDAVIVNRLENEIKLAQEKVEQLQRKKAELQRKFGARQERQLNDRVVHKVNHVNCHPSSDICSCLVEKPEQRSVPSPPPVSIRTNKPCDTEGQDFPVSQTLHILENSVNEEEFLSWKDCSFNEENVKSESQGPPYFFSAWFAVERA